MCLAAQDVQGTFDASSSEKFIKKLRDLEEVAGMKNTFVDPTVRGVAAITLTGWVALAALIALVVVIVGAIVFGYRRYMGLDKPYTIVTKSGDV